MQRFLVTLLKKPNLFFKNALLIECRVRHDQALVLALILRCTMKLQRHSIFTRSNPVLVLLFVLVLLDQRLSAQPPQFKMQSYIDKYSKEAVHQMVAYKIPASVILAQAIFESRSGTSQLAKKSNNHFGIKCHAEWNGSFVIQDDDTLNECFRKYDRIEDSYTDHSLFLVTRPRYAELFQLPITDYKAWCYGLKSLGYATYPTYAEELIRIIEQAQLYELDHSEKLNSSSIAVKAEKGEIVPSKYSLTGFSVNAFSKTGLLWLDEKDVLIQSLDMVIDHSDTAFDVADKDLIPSKYTPTDFTLRTFSKTGLLWMDEKDVLIQSLDILIEAGADDSSGLAGN